MFAVGQQRVIKCWDQGFIGLKKGSKANLVCPPEYGYGSRSRPGIPANSILKFSVEIIDVEKKKDQAKFSVNVTSKGSGPIVKKGDKIHAHYKGTLEDGTKFDSSYDRGKPLVFTVGQGRVIKCWDLGIVGIREGSKAELVCPPEYAYGSRRVGPIPPNSVLNFTIEVIKIETKKKKFAKTMWWMKKAPARPKYKRTITVEGEGPELKKGDTILAHYKVTL